MAIAFDHATAMETPSTESGAMPAERGGVNGGIASERVAPGPTATAAARDPRFHIFVIDSGWNCAASKVLHDHIDILSHLNIDDKLFVLDRAMSLALLRHY